ncbi:DNA replication and repair protein RecR [Catalinimonas alkaloidigena]|uniref:Recombination protein RecR n=1 Tax=Catalinimonas alkaloidigena TaxID=1075417 RepID=A0A1G9A490_9BACT|nr:recombination mediator RecR [Catalinimonas alkaloidigena]SDK21250.1 DNA replication and repair protein RecR [Catalinimonas alkaloidigena]
MHFSSKLIENAVNEVAKLPGIGRKTALRLVLHLLKEDNGTTTDLTEALTRLRQDITYCRQCHNISDHEICAICANPRRDQHTVCVIEDMRDVMAIENTSQYHGLYHVLGGVISPMEGVGPNDLHVASLVRRVTEHDVREVILALSPTMEGDTTAYYVTKKLREARTGNPLRISTIARGVPIGGNLEYADEITLGRSILARTNASE